MIKMLYAYLLEEISWIDGQRVNENWKLPVGYFLKIINLICSQKCKFICYAISLLQDSCKNYKF